MKYILSLNYQSIINILLGIFHNLMKQYYYNNLKNIDKNKVLCEPRESN